MTTDSPLGSALPQLEGIPDQDRAALRRAAAGRSRGWPGLRGRVALLVVDMTPAFVSDEWPTGWSSTGEPCARAIAPLLDCARLNGCPVVFTVPMESVIAAEAGQWLRASGSATVFPFDGPAQAREVVEELAPREDEIVLAKPKPSAFFGTQLVSILNFLEVTGVIVTGMTTSGCVRATVNDAFALNYAVTIPLECVADRSQVSHNVELFDMGAKYADVVPVEQVLSELARLS